MQADILGERARLTPERPALVVVEPELRLSYRELDARAVRCARLWTETLGLAKGDRVGILAHNRVEYLEAFFAAGKTGIVLVTLGTRLTAAELEHVVRDSGLRALFYDGALADTVRGLRQLVEIENWIAFDPAPAADAGDRVYGALVADLAEDSGWRPTPCDGEDVYCLLYTSGTTGRPKGVMIPHRMVAWNGFNTVCGWQLMADDVSPIFTPLYHAGGLMAFLVPIFVIGGTIVLHRDFDAGEIWRTIEGERCTVVLGVPTIWKMLLEVPKFAAADLRHVRWLISGGAPLPHYLIEAYQRKGVAFKQGFGMTEVGVNCFAMTVEDSVRKAGSIGQPMMFTEVRLVDGDGDDVAVGEVGEFLFRGPHVCKGYWNNPAATAAALDADGWFHSGDQARRDEDGFYYVAGRQKDMIISGGVNVYPAEIEAVLVQHPAVEAAAVVAVPDERWGEVGVAFVVLRQDAATVVDGDALGTEVLAAFLGERLARFKIPKAFRFVDGLPVTAYGKVVKGELRDAYLEGESMSDGLLAHQLQGDRGEVVLLLNGGMMTYPSWEPVTEGLLDAYRVLGCDFRGQLLSPGDGHRRLEDNVDDLVALLDALGLDSVHVLGTSFGGEVSVLLAAGQPSRVRTLAAVTAVDRTPPGMAEDVRELEALARQVLASGDSGPFHDALMREVYSPEYREAHAEELAARRGLTLPAVWYQGLSGILAAIEDFDLSEALGKIACPALIVHAALDAIMPEERVSALAAGIDGAELRVHPTSGHALVSEDPAWLVKTYRDFLARRAV